MIAYQENSERCRDVIKVEIIVGAMISELEAITILILAVAIVSIIAVSAKSRLSIMPRY